MSHLKRQLQHGEAGAGSVTTVVRSGDTIRRPAGPWTPTIHALLRHLSDKGYPYSPRVLGSDGESEILEYIEGEVALRPWPAALLADSGIAAIAEALRQYHEAVADFVPPATAVWRNPESQWQPGMIVRHGDLGPWNMVWREGRLAGIIDWDMAEPGSKIEDVAQVAWNAVPLRPPQARQEAGVLTNADQLRRFSILCEICEVSPSDVLHALARLQEQKAATLERLGSKGIEPWVTFGERGDGASIAEDAAWLREFAMEGVSDVSAPAHCLPPPKV